MGDPFRRELKVVGLQFPQTGHAARDLRRDEQHENGNGRADADDDAGRIEQNRHGAAEAEKALARPAAAFAQKKARAPPPALDAQMTIDGQAETGGASGQKERDGIALQQQEPGNGGQKVQYAGQGGCAHVVPTAAGM